MIYFVYSLYDAAARAFLAPQLNSTDDAAKRDLALGLSQAAGSPLGFAPKDFSLYKIAEFNTLTGMLTPISPTILICHASALVSPPEPEKNEEKKDG